MIKYRVILKVGYSSAWFEFNDGERATEFAKTALESMVANEDTGRKTFVSIEVFDKDLEKAEEND